MKLTSLIFIKIPGHIFANVEVEGLDVLNNIMASEYVMSLKIQARISLPEFLSDQSF